MTNNAQSHKEKSMMFRLCSVVVNAMLVSNLLSCQEADLLKSKGFIVIENKSFLKEDFNQVYQSFNNFIHSMTEKPEISKKFVHLKKNF